MSQIAASWGIAPAIAAGFGAVIMMSIKLLVHQRKDPLKAALRVRRIQKHEFRDTKASCLTVTVESATSQCTAVCRSFRGTAC